MATLKYKDNGKWVEFEATPVDGSVTMEKLSSDLQSVLQAAEDKKNIKVKIGTQVFDVGTAGSDAFLMWTRQKLLEHFGIPLTLKETAIFIGVVNGDGGASGAHVEGITWLSGSVYCVLNRNHSGQIRINYLIAWDESQVTLDLPVGENQIPVLNWKPEYTPPSSEQDENSDIQLL